MTNFNILCVLWTFCGFIDFGPLLKRSLILVCTGARFRNWDDSLFCFSDQLSDKNEGMILGSWSQGSLFPSAQNKGNFFLASRRHAAKLLHGKNTRKGNLRHELKLFLTFERSIKKAKTQNIRTITYDRLLK